MALPTTREDLGVYVHVPFCDRVCPYCDFAVEPVGRLGPALEAEYVGLLEAELELVCRALPDETVQRPLATVYLGGGTPSLLSPGAVERLLRALTSRFPRGDPEITLELNPGRSTGSEASAFRAAGVDRLSVGAQSFEDSTLKRLGRAHKGGDALRGLESVLAAGFRSVSVDLIHGAPGQTEADALRDVERVVDLGIPHVSPYELTLEPGTPFARAHDRGRLALPPEEEVARVSRRIEAALAAGGYRRYEVSSHARAGHRSRHNLRYWLRQDVLGLGVSAASLLGRMRARNPRDRSTWAASIARGELAWRECERLSDLDDRRETLFLGLRTTVGVSRADFWRRHRRRPEEDFGEELRDLRRLGLVEDRDGALVPTARGLLYSDDVLLRFASVDPPMAGG